MVLLSMNELTTYRWSFEEDVNGYLDAGIRSMAVWRQKLSDFGDDKGIELLAETEMAVSTLMWAGGFTGSDGRPHQDAVADALDAIQLAAHLEAGCLTVYSGGRGGHTTNHATRLLKEALTAMLPVAAELEVPLAIKPMDAACAGDCSFLTSLPTTMELLDHFDSPYLKLAYDTYHFGRDPAAVSMLPELVPQIAIVQLGDAKRHPSGEQNRCRLGEGMVPFARILEILGNEGYTGCFDVKLLGEDVEGFDYTSLLEHSKRQFESWLASAAH